jgi:hypothetical protein
VLSTRRPESIAQGGNMIDKSARTPVSKRNREEERPTWKKISSIQNHSGYCPTRRSAHAGYDINLREALVACMSAAIRGSFSRMSL